MPHSPSQQLPRNVSAEIAAKQSASRNLAAQDAELVRRFNNGDESAFNEIVLRHRDKILAIAQSVLRNPSDAEEIAQDTFIRAHRGLKKFRGECSLATWLHHVTVNLARNRYWYFHRRRRHASLSLDCPLSEDTAGTFADLIPSTAPEPCREAMTGEFSVLVTTCMEKLPPPQREILAMRNVLNRSYDEIATALGIEVGTVKSRIARARGQLRSLLAEACPEFEENAAPSEWFETPRALPGLCQTAA